MKELFLHGCSVNLQGTMSALWTKQVEHKTTEQPRSGRTQTGYGVAIPTDYMIKFNDKWRRVYCCIFSNSGTLYIKAPKGEVITVQVYGE
jgi:hypothetical protein